VAVVKATMVMDFSSELSRMSFGDLLDSYTSLSETMGSEPDFAVGPFNPIDGELSFNRRGTSGLPSPMTLPSV
jgi:hypothetical protein